MLPKNGNIVLLTLLPIWLVGSLVITASLVYGLISALGRFHELWLIVLALIATGSWMLTIWLWHLRGSEVLTTSPDRIEIARRGSFAHPVHTITLSELENISSSLDKDTLGRIRWWGLSGGTIRIQHLGRWTRFAQNMPDAAATATVQELKQYFHDHPL
jgi:hypothetical protein